MTISELKTFGDRTVVLHMCDGEVVTVKLRLVDAEYDDAIVDIIETNRPDSYKRSIQECAWSIPVNRIASVGQISERARPHL